MTISGLLISTRVMLAAKSVSQGEVLSVPLPLRVRRSYVPSLSLSLMLHVSPLPHVPPMVSKVALTVTSLLPMVIVALFLLAATLLLAAPVAVNELKTLLVGAVSV